MEEAVKERQIMDADSSSYRQMEGDMRALIAFCDKRGWSAARAMQAIVGLLPILADGTPDPLVNFDTAMRSLATARDVIEERVNGTKS